MSETLTTITIDYGKLRALTVDELLDMLSPSPEQDTSDNWKRLEEVLAPILKHARWFYEEHEDNVCHDAIFIAELAVGANGIDKDEATAITEVMAWLANSLLNAEGAEDWDAATVTALKAIRNTNAEIDPDDPPLH